MNYQNSWIKHGVSNLKTSFAAASMPFASKSIADRLTLGAFSYRLQSAVQSGRQ